MSKDGLGVLSYIILQDSSYRSNYIETVKSGSTCKRKINHPFQTINNIGRVLLRKYKEKVKQQLSKS